MAVSQVSMNESVSTEMLSEFENELRAVLRSLEARLREEPELDEISVAIRLRSEEAHGEVAAALSRIGDGSFGICERCQTAVGPDRLEAMPHARYCVSCATRKG